MTKMPIPIYELGLSCVYTLQAHSKSNAGTNGSNRLLPRRQLLADGTETDAISGNIDKHGHATLTAEYLEASGVSLCEACQQRDSRRAAALTATRENPLTMEHILIGCGLCDIHGFLVTPRNASSDGTTTARQRLSKTTLIDYSFGLARPDQQTTTPQLFVRTGDSRDEGQMIMKMSTRSGVYAQGIRYKACGIGADTDKWHLYVTNAEERIKRHRAVLQALQDLLLSPSGALSAKMLPHLTGISGAITLRTNVGRAPVYSGLAPDFITQLMATASDTCRVLPFSDVASFMEVTNNLIANSTPALPSAFARQEQGAMI